MTTKYHYHTPTAAAAHQARELVARLQAHAAPTRARFEVMRVAHKDTVGLPHCGWPGAVLCHLQEMCENAGAVASLGLARCQARNGVAVWVAVAWHCAHRSKFHERAGAIELPASSGTEAT